jgi:hypothetical protein
VEVSQFEVEVASGDICRALEALRDRLAAELAVKRGSGVPALARVLLEVLRDIGRLPAPGPRRSLEEELRDRRARREVLTARGEERVKRQGGRTKEQFPRTRFVPKGSS